MKDVLSDTFLIIATLILFIVGPIYVSYQSLDNIIYQEVKAATNDFQKEVRKNGYIDLNTYNLYLNRLNSTGKIYDIELIHTSNLVYPDTSTAEGFSTQRISYGNKSIIPIIYDNKKYTMKYGDDFKIEVKEKVPGFSAMLIGLATAQINIQTQFWADGGMVQNEAF
ncbi:hypothetical protein GKZ28_08585 [Clostridium chromiireducens]|jgi:hypothetical protein|uniref:Uncharacterized protein n=1 Tax=Clostridium chromiireducens TaxID=225345 RepID=A0A964RLQ5_9CLOT|nr:hypothetical protein [Clostridium chromiireducens]MVX63750.1 hypothetical protein [Clostridium chromiireducens]